MLIGIDVGGTKIEAVALSLDGTCLDRLRIDTPRAYEASLRAVVSLVAGLEARHGAGASVGVGIPGAVSPATGLVKNANSTWLNGRPLQADLGDALARPVRVENDANCFAVSEAVDGAGAGHRVVWGLILGTGVGSGIAIDGRALSGRHRIAGEWGHNPLPWPKADELPGPVCFCGRHGCIETFVSGPGFERDHAHRHGSAAGAAEIIASMRAGNAEARDSYRIYVSRLARGIAHVINVIDPNIIVLGGGMSNIEELYADLPPAVVPHVFSDAVTTPIVRNRHGDSSGVRGAAWLWNEAG